MMPGYIVISIKPSHVENIMAGTKTIELRRKFKPSTIPSYLYVYATAPIKAVVGMLHLEGVVHQSLEKLWHTNGQKTGVSYKAFREYFKGQSMGYGLLIKKAFPWPEPIPLDVIRESFPGWHPPQSWFYAKEDLRAVLHATNQTTPAEELAKLKKDIRDLIPAINNDFLDSNLRARAIQNLKDLVK